MLPVACSASPGFFASSATLDSWPWSTASAPPARRAGIWDGSRGERWQGPFKMWHSTRPLAPPALRSSPRECSAFTQKMVSSQCFIGMSKTFVQQVSAATVSTAFWFVAWLCIYGCSLNVTAGCMAACDILEIGCHAFCDLPPVCSRGRHGYHIILVEGRKN